MVPVSPVGPVDGWMTLGQARQGETVDGRTRPWSAGAGSGALATGLVQLAWVLERIGSGFPGLRCTTRPELWLGGDAGLFVWEAFVSGTGKPVPSGITQHAADAAAAADTFADRLEDATLRRSDVVCAPASSFNLAAAAAAYAGLAIPSDGLRDQVQVYRTRPGAKWDTRADYPKHCIPSRSSRLCQLRMRPVQSLLVRRTRSGDTAGRRRTVRQIG